ncbi:MAG: hypothetical protein E7384_02425 [Ruminococcaceae bacterium]|nr:hypothetical protein [Oscillospiraceae bacterium]
MKLYAKDLHFISNSPKEQNYDCCVHGKVVMKIGDISLSDGESDWCVSASAYRFLHSLFENHFLGTDEQLIPCCGHFLLPSEDKTKVTIGSCPNGIDFDVICEKENVTIRTQDTHAYTVPFEEYKTAVLSYAKQIEDFYHQNPPRQFENDFDRDGFSAFCNEWYDLMNKAMGLPEIITADQEITFDDYESYSENDIVGISPNGISLKNMKLINFRECAYNFEKIHSGNGKCIATRDATGTNPSFAFYTAPKTTHIFFLSKGKLKEFFAKKNTMQRFHELQKQIEAFGFTTYDET